MLTTLYWGVYFALVSQYFCKWFCLWKSLNSIHWHLLFAGVMGKGFQGGIFRLSTQPIRTQKMLLRWGIGLSGPHSTIIALLGMQFYHNCEILGPNATYLVMTPHIFRIVGSIRHNCPLQVLVVARQSRTNPVLDAGFVFHICHFLTTPYQPKEEESTKGQTCLAGSVAAYSRTVVMLSSIDGWWRNQSWIQYTFMRSTTIDPIQAPTMGQVLTPLRLLGSRWVYFLKGASGSQRIFLTH